LNKNVQLHGEEFCQKLAVKTDSIQLNPPLQMRWFLEISLTVERFQVATKSQHLRVATLTF